MSEPVKSVKNERVKSESSQPVQTVLVYGLGRSGKAVCRLLAAQGCAFVVIDERLARDPKAVQEAVQDDIARADAAFVADVGGTLLGTLEQLLELSPKVSIACCIAAPGVPWQHPDLVTLRARGIETIGEVEWVYRTLIAPAKHAGHDVTLIGITGTAGKTSTTYWTHTLLEQAGKRAFTGGNTGQALADVVLEAGFVAHPSDLAGVTLVIELSSFQLERCPQFRPDIAVILNLGVDHLDRHGSVRDYHLAKKNLLTNLSAEDTFIYNADDPKLAAWAKETPARAWGFSSTVNPIPAARAEPSRYPAYYYEDQVWLEQHPLIDASNLQVQGSHQHHNALAVALVGRACGLAPAAIRLGLQAFVGVPGRYALVADIAGVRFVEDSIATRTLAVHAALAATPAPIVWLAGGQDKGAETDSLRALVQEKVLLLVGIGEAGRTFAEAFADVTTTRVCAETDGERALAQACRWGIDALKVARGTPGASEDVEQKTSPETSPTSATTFPQASPETSPKPASARLGTVLLAPLAASFDQFADYHARAQAFRRVVADLAQSTQAVTVKDVSMPSEEATWTVS